VVLAQVAGGRPREEEGVQQAYACLAAVALALRARADPDPARQREASDAREALRSLPPGASVGWLPWRTAEGTLAALEALERGVWRPGQQDAQGRCFPYPVE
jgi:hypothetical protein